MAWPRHRAEERPWVSRQRQGSRADRTLERITVSVPPLIADLDYDPIGPVGRAHETALIAITSLDAEYGEHPAGLAEFLLRSESVASSKIEHIDAGWRAFGKAIFRCHLSCRLPQRQLPLTYSLGRKP